MLDLVWSNTFAEALESNKYNCTSDHKTIAGSILVTRISDTSGITPELCVRDQDLEKFSRFVKAWVKPGPMNDASDMENQVSGLVEALQDAVRAVGRKPIKACGRKAPWWNEECITRNQEFRRSRYLPEVAAQARNRFRAAVEEAKREHWRELVKGNDRCTNFQDNAPG